MKTRRNKCTVLSMAERKLILVTGGAGLVGTRLCARLAHEGHTVISLDNYFAGSRDNHVQGVEYREGHTKDIEQHVPETPDVIFHLGEYSRVEQSLLEPDIVHDLNTVGTKGVVEYWRKRRSKLIYAGSSTKFGDEGRAREATPYASTKAANTELVKEVGDREKLPYAITYFYNVYGPGERAGIYGTLIETYKQMFLQGVPLTVVSPGTQQRNFTHVDDIVDGLLKVAERGHGDEYGLGNDKSYTILEVARMFGGEIVMLPERAGNRMTSRLDASRSHEISWYASRNLEAYIGDFLRTHMRGSAQELRVLVFSTTFYPTMGPAEDALMELARSMPSVEFDVVTTLFTRAASREDSPLSNVHIHRVGIGFPIDKFLLPLLGLLVGRKLYKQHHYLFAWSLMASYAALAGVYLKRTTGCKLLITLADQDLSTVSGFSSLVLRHVFPGADQVYGITTEQDELAKAHALSPLSRRSMGDGDAFANQIRYSYAEKLSKFGAQS